MEEQTNVEQVATETVEVTETVEAKTESEIKTEVEQNVTEVEIDEQQPNNDIVTDSNVVANENGIDEVLAENAKVESVKIESSLTPKTVYARMHLDHIGRIFSNIGLVSSILSIAVLMIPLLLPIYILALIIITFAVSVFTLGLIYLSESTFIPDLWGSMNNVELIMQYVGYTIPVLFGVAMVSSILGIILMLCSKHKCTWRIATNSAILILPILALIIILAGVLV